jgi:hypothetical protein
MDLEGSIKVIMDTQTFDSGFQKKEFVVTTKEQYPQDVKFELIKDRIDILSPYNQGDQVKVHFNVRGNEYKGRYYVNLQAWRIEALGAGGGAAAGGNGADPFGDAGFPEEGNAPTASSEPDDLPF